MKTQKLVLVLLIIFCNTCFVLAQSYLKKNVVDDNYILKKDLETIVEKSQKWLRFKSKNCKRTIDYLSKLENLIEEDTALYVMTMCDFDMENYKQTKIKYRNIDKELLENILKNDQIRSMNNDIDDYRFSVAASENNLEALYGYLECKYFKSIGLKHKQEVDSLIFVLSNPKLYELAPHYRKLNDLILFLENERNYDSHYYFKALYSLYLIYTNDGESKTINLLTSNDSFNTCKQRCDQKDINYLNTVIANDLKQCEIFDSLKNIKFPEIKIMDEFIRNNLPKESAYKVLLKRVSGDINKSISGFRQAKEYVDVQIQYHLGDFDLFPEMMQKLVSTSKLYDNTLISKSISKLQSKANIGYGPIDNVFLTKNSVFYSICDPYYNNLATEDENYNENTVILPKFKIKDMSYDGNKICVIKENKLVEVFTKDESPIFPVISEKNEEKTILNLNNTQSSKNDNLEFENITSEYGKQNSYIVSKDNRIKLIVWEDLNLNNNCDIYMLADIFNNTNCFDEKINTLCNETCPFLIGDTLFFSSDGLYGFGGFDIYMSIKGDNGWGTPKTLDLESTQRLTIMDIEEFVEKMFF